MKTGPYGQTKVLWVSIEVGQLHLHGWGILSVAFFGENIFGTMMPNVGCDKSQEYLLALSLYL